MTRTAIHLPTGEMVTPEGFIAREGADYRQRGAWPQCPACGAGLFVHGVHSPNVTSRFRHAEGSVCPLSASPDPRFAHLVPEAWDPAAGERLLEELCEEDNLKHAYLVCRWLCGGHLPSKEFVGLCKKAVRLGLFRYKGLPLWVVPWLLVTLDDFTRDMRSPAGRHVSKDGRDKRQYQFRFILQKPDQAGIETAWISPSRCSLEKVFADSGKRMRNGIIPLRKEIKEVDQESTAWIGRALLARLRECCRGHGHHE